MESSSSGLTGTQKGLLIGGLLLIICLAAFLVWWFVFKKQPPLPDCLEQIKAKCKPGGGDVTCEEYGICVQRSDVILEPCNSTWETQNCGDYKPGPGKGTLVGKTLTWEGPYFKISTLGGGGLQASIPEVDLTKIDTVVLKLDFSDVYKNNNTGPVIAVGLSINMKVKDLVTKYKNFTAEVSDSNVIPGNFQGMTKFGNIYVGDSTTDSPSTKFEILTNGDLNNTKKVVTLNFK